MFAEQVDDAPAFAFRRQTERRLVGARDVVSVGFELQQELDHIRPATIGSPTLKQQNTTLEVFLIVVWPTAITVPKESFVVWAREWAKALNNLKQHN